MILFEKQKPLISIIIPTYKRHAVQVRKAILSALNQTYENVEVVVVDDNASPENKVFRDEILNMVSKIDSKQLVCVCNKINLGGSLSRNVGIDASRGDYISFLDDDDEYLPNKISNQYAHMNKENLDISISNMYIYNEFNQVIDIREFELNSYDYIDLKKYHLTKQITGTPRFLFKRNVLVDVGGFDDAVMGQEWFLIDKIIEKKCYKFGYIPICDIKVYRTKNESISNSKNKIVGERRIYECKKAFSYLLTKKEKRYLAFRHNVILCIAYKRNHKFLLFLTYCFMIGWCFPLNTIKEIKNAFNNKKKCKHINKIKE
ncbi:glycosyltransferase family 2 protein [bacterium]|nr:glycosyltransferase family 2 protein [bacterium]